MECLQNGREVFSGLDRTQINNVFAGAQAKSGKNFAMPAGLTIDGAGQQQIAYLGRLGQRNVRLKVNGRMARICYDE